MRWFVWISAVAGAITLCLLAYVIADAARVSRWAANKILANTVSPVGQEMPTTTYAIPYSSTDVQVIGGRGEGVDCSIPWLAHALVFHRIGRFAPIELEMRQACVSHDYCYRHGAATYGYTQADCDALLQEQSFRLCLFVERDRAKAEGRPDKISDQANSVCRGNARVITLGVQLGGSESFRRVGLTSSDVTEGELSRLKFDTVGSTYFEYDPYPVRSPHYWAYRLADAPPEEAVVTRSKKALYAFEIRPSGATVHVITLAQGASRVVRRYELRGQQQSLTRPPIVVRPGTGPASQDWLVWWQRYDFTNTGGRIVALAPGRATVEDWQRADDLFPEIHQASDCKGAGSEATMVNPAVAIFYLGKAKCYDPNFLDVYAAPGLSTSDSNLRLMTVRIQSCQDKTKGDRERQESICFTDMILDPSKGGGHQAQTPNIARDSFSAAGESDLYRNFVTAPLPFLSGDKPSLAWFRRGDEEGNGWGSQAFVRRLTVRDRGSVGKETGASVGTLILKEFGEKDEPVIITGRKVGPTRLLTVRSSAGSGADKQSIIRQWTWPIGQHPPGDEGPQSVEPNGLCSNHFDASWHARPIVSVADARGTLLVASRISLPTKQDRKEMPALHIATMRLTPDGHCSELTERLSIPIKELVETGKELSLVELLWRMRSQPVLVDDIDGDGHLDLVIPHFREVSKSRVVLGAFSPD